MAAPRGRTATIADRGSAALALVLAVTAVAAAVIMAASAVGSAVVERTRAQTAADATALAALVSGSAVASAVADRHDATIESWHRTGDTVTVVVRVGNQTATARATDSIDP